MRNRLLTVMLTIALVYGLFSAAYADSNLVYSNDFSSGSLKTTEWKQWNLDPSSNGVWDIADVNGNKLLRGQIAKFDDTIAHYKAKKYKDVTVEADVILERGNALGIIIRMDDLAQGYQLIFDQYDGVKLCRRPYYVFKSGGTVDTGVKYHVEFSAIGDKIKAIITNTSTQENMTLEITDTLYQDSGFVGFNVFGIHFDGTSNAVGLFDNLKIYSGKKTADSSDPVPSITSEPAGSTSSQAVSVSTSITELQSQTSTGASGLQSEEISTIPSDESNNSDSTVNEDAESSVPGFIVSSLYSDLSVDNTSRIVRLERTHNISELVDSFSFPDGYSIKIIDGSNLEVTDNQRIVNESMKIKFTDNGSDEFIYSIKLNYSDESEDSAGSTNKGKILWVIIPVVVIICAVVAFLLILKSKKKN